MTAETIAVLGANGVYARHLIPRLTARGHRVRALVRRPEAATVARACGAEIRVADIFDGSSLEAALAGASLAINLATSLPGPSGRGDFAANDALRRNGTPVWAEACRTARVPRMIQQSIAMVNVTDGDSWSDEDAASVPVGDDVAGRAIESGTLRLPGDGQRFVSLVHIADMAAATVAAIESERWQPGTLIVADDRPARWSELFAYVAALAGAPAPEPGGRLGFPSFRVRNARARERLDWAPRYEDFRAGLVR